MRTFVHPLVSNLPFILPRASSRFIADGCTGRREEKARVSIDLIEHPRYYPIRISFGIGNPACLSSSNISLRGPSVLRVSAFRAIHAIPVYSRLFFVTPRYSASLQAEIHRFCLPRLRLRLRLALRVVRYPSDGRADGPVTIWKASRLIRFYLIKK